MNAAEILPFPAPSPPPGAGPTVAQIVQLWIDRRFAKLAPTTQAVRRPLLDEFVKARGTLLASECSPDDLESWLEDMAERWRSAETRRGAYQAVNTVFNWATIKARKIQANPFKGASQEHGKPRRAMTDEEFRGMLRHTSAIFRRVLFFLRLTGCRPCELRELEWDFIDPVKGIIVWEKNKTLHKTGKSRVVRLTPVISKLLGFLLQQQLQAGLDEKFVFLNSRGGVWTKNNLVQRVDRIRERAGIPQSCKLYGARHLYATAAAVNGVRSLELAELMGHTSTRTLERYYIHLDAAEQHMRSAAEQAIRRQQ
jgi:integrase